MFCILLATQGDPQIGVGVAGDVNVSVSFEGRFAGGLALNKRTFMTAAPGRPPRQFQVYAQVDSVSPSTGSLAGGTLVTITGKGFPSSAAAGNSVITGLTVGSMPCKVVSSNFSSIVCLTETNSAGVPSNSSWCRWNSSSAANATASNTTSWITSNNTIQNATVVNNTACWDGSIRGRFPGMRGIMYEFFYR